VIKRIIAFIVSFILLVAMGALVYYFILVRNAANVDVEAAALEETNASYEQLINTLKSDATDYKHTVLIDPAAGGMNKGLSQGTICESDITLSIASYVKQFNDNSDIRIVLSRDTDTNPTCEQRNNIIDLVNPDMIIELHVLSDISTSKMGVSAYYSDEFYNYLVPNSTLADLMVRDTAARVQTAAEGIFLREEASPLNISNAVTSLVFNCGYISNAEEGHALMSDAYRQNMARGILDAIEEAYGYGDSK